VHSTRLQCGEKFFLYSGKNSKLWVDPSVMKKQFWFISLFGVWCLLSSLWYFLSVKGVVIELKGFVPQTAWIAIIEILVMLLVACLLGYAIAWHYRSETIDDQNEKLEAQHQENNSLIRVMDDYKNQVEVWREKHFKASQQKSSVLISEKEKLQRHKAELESSLKESRNETREVQSRLLEVESEIGTLRYRNRQLEFQAKELEESNSKLKSEIENLAERKEKKSISDHPFVRPVEADEKDDLTKIKGVGPFIEKRLNMIGIYTFQQLAELSPEMIDRVGAAIEFFPHRIIKDNWVGQASRFAKA
jgi:predicted flap endonuclease-1-like 5' DNA nuclease